MKNSKMKILKTFIFILILLMMLIITIKVLIEELDYPVESLKL